MPIVELDLELGIGQRIHDGTIHLDGVVLGHAAILTRWRLAHSRARRIETRATVKFLGVASSGSRAAAAALRFEAVGAIDRLVATRLERHPRLAIATRTRGDEHLASWRGGETATAGITGWTERI